MKRNKEDLACAKVIADLTTKGYSVFFPLVAESQRFNLIAYNHNDEYYRIKVEYSTNGYVPNSIPEVDYFAMYLPDVDTVIYPGTNFCGQYINFVNSREGAYWYKDFLDLTDKAERREIVEIECCSNIAKRVAPYKEQSCDPRKNTRMLQMQVDSLGYTGTGRIYGVSDNTIRYWLNNPYPETSNQIDFDALEQKLEKLDNE
jgi:hypothetical protein